MQYMGAYPGVVIARISKIKVVGTTDKRHLDLSSNTKLSIYIGMHKVSLVCVGIHGCHR